MRDLESDLALRDIRLITRMKLGWQFGHDSIDYFAKKRRKKIFADSLDEVLNRIDQYKPIRPQPHSTVEDDVH
jgi:hypothetical protein